MVRKAISGIMLTLLLIGILTLKSNIQSVEASGTIYIRADGSVEPPGAPILNVGNTSYTFIDNIHDSIVVERDNIIIDGAGYSVQGTGAYFSIGIYLSERRNVTVKNVEIEAFYYGIWLYGSSNNSVVGNSITANNMDGIFCKYSNYNNIVGNSIAANNMDGIYLHTSSNNNVAGNTITANNWFGILLHESSNNTLRNNSMTNNVYNFHVWGWSLSHFVNNVDASNTVDGKPVYYWINDGDRAVPLDAGYVALANCTRVTVQNLNLNSNGQGVLLAYTTNSTITENSVTNNWDGIYLHFSPNNSIIENNVTNNGYGVYLIESSNNNIDGNNVANNGYGIYLYECSSNVVYHNNFVNNTNRVDIYNSVNVWDDGYPSGGNYWSDYDGTDIFSGSYQNVAGSDGLGDNALAIDADNRDQYPLMGSLNTFDAGTWNLTSYSVDIISNSTVSKFQLNIPEKKLRFKVTGETGSGFCRVTIPNVIIQGMWQGNYSVLINNQHWSFTNWTDLENTYIYFTYQNSEHEVTIIPEFPQAAFLPLITVLATLAVILKKRKIRKKE